MAFSPTNFLLGLPTNPGFVAAGGAAPAITSDGGGATADVSVNTGDTAVTTVVASDTGTITYSIVGGAEALMFEIDPDTGELAFTKTSVDGVYEVIVAATSDWGVDTQTITVTVAAYHVDAVHFDGSTWLSIASLLSTNNAFFSISFWQKLPTNSIDIVLVSDPNNDFTPSVHLGLNGLDAYEKLIAGSGGANELRIQNDQAPFIDFTVWRHILVSFDAQSSIGKAYISDAAYGNLDVSGIPFNFSMNGKGFSVGGDTFGGNVVGDLSEMWIAPGVSLLTAGDIPEATRRKFISATGKPVFLGADGSIPTGTAPAIFFSGDATGFVTNKGTGGAFMLTGSLINASTSPSD